MAQEFIPEVQQALIDLFIVERACGQPVTPGELTGALSSGATGVSENFVLDRMETLANMGVLDRSTGVRQGTTTYHATDGTRVDLERLKPWVDFVSKDLKEHR